MQPQLGPYNTYLILYVLSIIDYLLFTEEDECQPNPCLNGGRCMAHFFGGGFDCECPLGYRGTTCRGRLQIYEEMETLKQQLIMCAL